MFSSHCDYRNSFKRQNKNKTIRIESSKPKVSISLFSPPTPPSLFSLHSFLDLIAILFYFFLNPFSFFPLPFSFIQIQPQIFNTHFPIFKDFCGLEPSFNLLGCSPMASFTVPCPKASTLPGLGSTAQKNWHQSHIKYNLSLSHRGLCLKDSFSFGSSFADRTFSGIEVRNKKKSAGLIVYALNEVAVGKTSNSAPALVATPVSGGKVDSAVAVSNQNSLHDESSISAFMSQVSDLIKLVDSRDIMELQLKQQGCEIVIRKKEALQPPAPAPAPSPYIALPPPQAHSMFAPPPTPAPAPTAAPASPPPPAPKAGSSHPPLKCPMAGTFYRSPAPGEPPFVKVGDKVQKGQIICIIEAMKLMNEIEADQSGTITEILAEDGKPVSVDMPLLVIVP